MQNEKINFYYLPSEEMIFECSSCLAKNLSSAQSTLSDSYLATNMREAPHPNKRKPSPNKRKRACTYISRILIFSNVQNRYQIRNKDYRLF